LEYIVHGDKLGKKYKYKIGVYDLKNDLEDLNLLQTFEGTSEAYGSEFSGHMGLPLSESFYKSIKDENGLFGLYLKIEEF